MTLSKISCIYPRLLAVLLGFAALSLAGCSDKAPKTVDVGSEIVEEKQNQSLLDRTRVAFVGTDEPLPLGVNPALWWATLDTLVFVPIASADPFGGTVVTDWSTPPGVENERFKINVLLRSKELTADGVLVKLFRQEWRGEQGWIDVPSSEGADKMIRDAILTRVRLRERAKLEPK